MKRLLATVIVATVLTLAASPAGAVEPLEIDASIGGRDITTADSTEPIEIEPKEETRLQLTITNTGDGVEQIRFVRLEGTALGLTFLTYDLGIRTTLEPGEQATVDAALDFFDLDQQATGYLGTSLRVYDTERRLLGEQDFVVDVRGKATSTLGLFAFIVLGIAVFSVVVLVLNTLRRRLPSNRFVRGLQFAIAGAAIGVTLALGVSILRIGFADVEEWVPVVMLPTLVAFALGYIAPGPLSQSIQEVREEEALQYVAEATVARASGMHPPASSGRYSRESLDRAIAHQDPSEDIDLTDEPAPEAQDDPADDEPVNETT